jgi:hypothetical protein
MSNLIDDFKILRSQVCPLLITDDTLKELFRQNKYDIVNTLLAAEKQISGKQEYILEDLTIKPTTDVVKKISELRKITNEKDELIRQLHMK